MRTTHSGSNIRTRLDTSDVDSIVVAILIATTTIASRITLNDICETIVVCVDGDS